MGLKKCKANLIPYKLADAHLLYYLSLRSIHAHQFPGHFGFWGGGIEIGEMPEDAMLREIWEELCYVPTRYNSLGLYYDRMPNAKFIFYCQVTDDFESIIRIREGQGGKFFAIHEIESQDKIINEDKVVLRRLERELGHLLIK